MSSVNPQIEAGWLDVLKEEFTAEYFVNLKKFLVEEKKQHTVYPPGSLIFAAFNHTPWANVKVVILGQDPYHGPGQANGLCFSVSPGVRKPPSLDNIFKELSADLNLPMPLHGNLEKWATQGVLLLNTTLTVREGQAASHQGQGWEQFTDTVIKRISDEKHGIVFLLWGRHAQQKEALIDAQKHFILTAAHPSPLAGGKFFGCRHFSRTNDLLRAQGKPVIDWRL